MIHTNMTGSISNDSLTRYIILASRDWPEIQKKLLIALADKGELNLYQYSEEKNIWYSSIHQAAQALKKYGLVRSKSGKGKKNVKADTYELTEAGAMVLFTLRPRGLNREAVINRVFSEPFRGLLKSGLFGERYSEIFRQTFLDFLKISRKLKDSEEEKSRLFIQLLGARWMAGLDQNTSRKLIQDIAGNEENKRLLKETLNILREKIELFQKELGIEEGIKT